LVNAKIPKELGFHTVVFVVPANVLRKWLRKYAIILELVLVVAVATLLYRLDFV
jgi:hypothetical protein